MNSVGDICRYLRKERFKYSWETFAREISRGSPSMKFSGSSIRRISESHPGTIKEVRGLGLMIGIELAFPAKAVWEELIRRGFICNLSHEVVLRLLPALNIPEEDLRAFADTLEDILANIKK